MRPAAALCICLPLIAWIPASAEQLPIKAYTTADGLAHNHINCIRQDSRGFIWFCTDEGLSRFDGYGFVNYTTRDGLPHPWVNDLLEARDGGYWVATDGGVCQFRPNRQSAAEPMFVTYLPGPQPEARRVNTLVEGASGVIWCATYNGLYRLDRSSNHVNFQSVDLGMPGEVNEGRLINNLLLDRQNVLWLAARTGLYRRLSDGRAERYTRRNGLPDDFIETLFQDRGGRWWAATRTGGFCLLAAELKPNRPVIERCYSTTDGLPHNDVRSIFASFDGKMWIGTVGGLSEFTPSAATHNLFQNYGTENGLSEVQIFKFAEDRDGNLWMGTRRGGAMRMVRRGMTSYTVVDGFRPGSSHRGIFETADSRLCVLTSTGARGFIQCFNGKKFTTTEIHLSKTPGASSFEIEDGFQDRAGEWWVATRQGLIRFPRAAHVEELAHLSPKAIYKDADPWPYQKVSGEVLTSTHGVSPRCLTRWNPSTDPRPDQTPDPKLVFPINSAAGAFAEDASGNLWVGLREHDGLLRCRAGRCKMFLEGTGNDRVNALHVDGIGRLWIASAQTGVHRVDDPGSSHPRITSYTTADGLSSNESLCLTEDQWGRIYVGTNRGVDRLDPRSGFIRHYATADGITRGAVAYAHRDRHGMLWFVADEGISRLSPVPDPAPVPPPILITGIRTMGVPQRVSELGETQIEKLRLAPNRNQLQIDFVGLDLRPGAALRYRYKLEGSDPSWSAPTTERTVHYASLAAGTYRFLVQAVSSDGIASRTPASVAFTVLAPVWKQWWFITAGVLLASLAIFGMHRLRVGQLLEMERIRMRIATDLHDDIGSSLSQISVLSEVLRSRLQENDTRQTEAASKIAEISRELTESISDAVWAISPRRDRLRDLVSRMREFAGDLFIPRDIKLHFEAPAAEGDLRLDLEARRQFFLIFKECAHNMVRHAQPSEVSFRFAIESNWLVLRASDNGKGFDLHGISDYASRKGDGLASMRQRADKLGGTVELTSSPGCGTTVRVKIPLRG